MFGLFEKKQQDAIDHWYALIPSFNTPAKDFYVAIEKELKDRQVPDWTSPTLISPKAACCHKNASICG